MRYSEKIGAKGEELFKEMLDDKNVAFFYIGQSVKGVEYSKAIKKDMNACRPDFFVNLQSSGKILVDVKTHRKYRLDKANELFFYLKTDEISKLLNLHTSIDVPVWVAFVSAEEIDKEDPYFHFISIKELNEYNEGLKKHLEEKYETLTYIRVPFELFTKFKKKDKKQPVLAFDSRVKNVAPLLIENFAKKHKTIIQLIENEVEKIPEYEKRKIIKIAKAYQDSNKIKQTSAEKNKEEKNSKNPFIKKLWKNLSNIPLEDIENIIKNDIKKIDELKNLPNIPRRKPSRFKQFIKIIIPVAATLLILAGGSYFYNEKNKQHSIKNSTPPQKTPPIQIKTHKTQKVQLYTNYKQEIPKAIPVR